MNDVQDRLKNLTNSGPKSNEAGVAGYSRFIRRMRYILPAIAVCIIAVVFSWGNMVDDRIVPVTQQDPQNQTVGKNELLNPRFESTDEKNQPYTITADRALQGSTDEDLVVLEKPLGDILLNDGTWVALSADKGAFWQDTQRLLLQEKVQIFHDEGYRLETEKLNIDLTQNQTWSDEEVLVQGPAGRIESVGLKGDSQAEILTFTGPAKLVLFDTGEGGLFND